MKKILCEKCFKIYAYKNTGIRKCPFCGNTVSYEKGIPIKKPKKIGRNELCPCGSGLKYKQCCLIKEKESNRKLKEIISDKQNGNN